jgi:DNA-binding transcriptional regulator YdaS (Cro superfamily)
MKLKDLTPKQRAAIAKRAKLHVDSVRQMSTGYRGGSAKTAIKIERAAKALGLVVLRESLCAGCNMCEFAKAARKVQS